MSGELASPALAASLENTATPMRAQMNAKTVMLLGQRAVARERLLSLGVGAVA